MNRGLDQSVKSIYDAVGDMQVGGGHVSVAVELRIVQRASGVGRQGILSIKGGSHKIVKLCSSRVISAHQQVLEQELVLFRNAFIKR